MTPKAFVFMSVFIATASMVVAQDQSQVQPATQQDVRSAAKRIERSVESSNGQTREAINGIAAGQEGVARSVEKQGTDTRAAVEEVGVKLADELKKEAAKNMRSSRSMALGVSLVGVAMLSAIYFTLWNRSARNTGKRIQAQMAREVELPKRKTWEILRNPSHDVLKEALLRAGLTEGVFEMTVPSDDPESAPVISVTGVLNQHGRIMVRDPETGNLLVWKDKRNVGSLKKRVA